MDSATSLLNRPLPRRTVVTAPTILRVQQLVLRTMLIGCIALSSCSYAAPGQAKKTISHAASNETAIRKAAIEYCLSNTDSDSNLIKGLGLEGIKAEPTVEPAPKTWPKRFYYVRFGAIEWLSSKRVQLSFGEQFRFSANAVNEVAGTLYLDHILGKWWVDESATTDFCVDQVRIK